MPDGIFYEQGRGGPIILLCMSGAEMQELDHLRDCIVSALPDSPLAIAVFRVEDWFGEFSPWETPSASEGHPFSGRGPETLQRMLQSFSTLKAQTGERPVVITGYSLAGLFALWAEYVSGQFDGVICCSGSLWYPGWNEFAESHSLPQPCAVYLSLGGKEENTDHPQMKQVGICTRMQEKRLKREENVYAAVLEWNSGGHFADSGKRIAKGVRWMLGHLRTGNKTI